MVGIITTEFQIESVVLDVETGPDALAFHRPQPLPLVPGSRELDRPAELVGRGSCGFPFAELQASSRVPGGGEVGSLVSY